MRDTPKQGLNMLKLWALMLTSMLLLIGCSGSADEDPEPELLGAVFDPPRMVEDFTLMSTSGEDFTLSDHRGEAILLYFGYLTCPDFCPTTFLELRRVYQLLDEPQDQLKIVFVTVDPERDSLDYLTAYTNRYHEDFIGLRDDGEALDDLLDQFGIVVEQQQLSDSSLAYLIDHTVSVFLIAPNGELQAQYLYGTDYHDIVHDMELILENS